MKDFSMIVVAMFLAVVVIGFGVMAVKPKVPDKNNRINLEVMLKDEGLSMNEGLKVWIGIACCGLLYLVMGSVIFSVYASAMIEDYDRCGKVDTTILYIIKTDLFCD